MHKKVLVTGVGGFIMSHVAAELLDHGWEVVGLDTFQAHGQQDFDFAPHPRFRLVQGDASDRATLTAALAGCTHCIAGAAHSGGSAYLRTHEYAIFRDNQRITDAVVACALDAHRRGDLQRLTLISSSMIFEQATSFPVPENFDIAPPRNAYGFQKLAAQRLVEAAHRQFGLPYTVLVYFNHAGRGRHAPTAPQVRQPAQVLPDLARRILGSTQPVAIWGNGQQVRYFTHGSDLARGTRLALESAAAEGRSLQLSSGEGTTVLEAARRMWALVHPAIPFQYSVSESIVGDVQQQVPDGSLAESLLGFRASVSLDQILHEVIEAVRGEMAAAPT